MLTKARVFCLLLAALVAPSHAQTACSSLPSRARVQSDVGERGGLETEPVVFSCASYSDYNQKIFDSMTAYSNRFYLDYNCNHTGSGAWEVTTFNIDLTGGVPASRDAGSCKRCGPAASAPGHCDPCSGQCAICTTTLCYQCDEGFSLAPGNVCATDNALTDGIIAVIVVCVVLAVIFAVLLIAAIGLIIYIVMFTKTEEIAHRKIRDDKSPVSYQRRSQVGTFRQNPVFGAAGGWTDQDGGGRQDGGGWSNPLAQPKRTPLTMDTGKDEEEDEEASIEEHGGDEDDDGYEI